eukprot:8569856-Pyramimonas_sp.AAC.1
MPLVFFTLSSRFRGYTRRLHLTDTSPPPLKSPSATLGSGGGADPAAQQGGARHRSADQGGQLRGHSAEEAAREARRRCEGLPSPRPR